MRRLDARVALVFAALVFGSLALQGLFAAQYLAESLGLHATTVGGENEFRCSARCWRESLCETGSRNSKTKPAATAAR